MISCEMQPLQHEHPECWAVWRQGDSLSCDHRRGRKNWFSSNMGSIGSPQSWRSTLPSSICEMNESNYFIESHRVSCTIPLDNIVRTFHLSSRVSRPAAIDSMQPLLGYFRTNSRFIFVILNIHFRFSIAIPKNRLLIPQAIEEISFQRRKIGSKYMNK